MNLEARMPRDERGVEGDVPSDAHGVHNGGAVFLSSSLPPSAVVHHPVVQSCGMILPRIPAPSQLAQLRRSRGRAAPRRRSRCSSVFSRGVVVFPRPRPRLRLRRRSSNLGAAAGWRCGGIRSQGAVFPNRGVIFVVVIVPVSSSWPVPSSRVRLRHVASGMTKLMPRDVLVELSPRHRPRIRARARRVSSHDSPG